MLVAGKTFRNCDECAKPKSCSIIGLKQLNDKSQTRYIFYICDECMENLSDVGGTQELLKSIDL